MAPVRLPALAFTAALILTSCDFPPDPDSGEYYSVEELEAMPEAQLIYPGATALGRNSTPRTVHIDGANHAVVRAGFGSSEAHDRILAWYGAELRSRGWAVAGNSRDSTEVVAQEWRKTGLRFRAGVDERDPGDPRLLSPEAQARFATTFHTALFASERLD